MDMLIVNKRFAGEQHDIRDFVTPNQVEILGLYEHLKQDDPYDTVELCWRYLNKYVQYPATPLGLTVDKQRLITFGGAFVYDQPEDYWQFPYETTARVRWAEKFHQKTFGDCLPLNTEIYTPEGLAKVGDLKLGDEVLSYDFEKREYCYKPVIKIWEKGQLPIKKIKLRNGHILRTTNDHPFWCRRVQANGKPYVKKYLKDIDLTNGWARRIPCAKKLPYKIIDVDWLNEELCFVTGHFIAEGWQGDSHVCTSGYACNQITPLLKKYSIPFSEGKNGNGVPIVRFLKSDFKDFLKSLISSSFDIHLPEWFFHLPEKKLQSFIDGHFLGDGNYIAPYKGSFESLNWSTSSEEFAYALNRMFLQLGNPVYFYKQEHHGGVGKRPIWRLRFKEGSSFCRNHGYPNLSEVSIKSIEDDGIEETRDFEVADTHSFVFKNGVIGHQCADVAFVMASVLRNQLGPNEVHACIGTYVLNGKPSGHAWVKFRIDLNIYYADPTKDFGKTMNFDLYDEYVLFNDIELNIEKDVSKLLY